jgi:hypothetical protein
MRKTPARRAPRPAERRAGEGRGRAGGIDLRKRSPPRVKRETRAKPAPGATGSGVTPAGVFLLSSFSLSFVRNGPGVPSEARSLTRGKIKNKEEGFRRVASLPIAPARAITPPAPEKRSIRQKNHFNQLMMDILQNMEKIIGSFC